MCRTDIPGESKTGVNSSLKFGGKIKEGYTANRNVASRNFYMKLAVTIILDASVRMLRGYPIVDS